MKLFSRRLIRPGNSDAWEQLYGRVAQAVDAWIDARGYLKVLPTLPEIAGDLGVAPDHLSNYIRIATGDTVLGWRKTLRIEEAKMLLREYPSLPVSAVAAMVGIGDKSNFKRQFIEEVHMSPAEWRAQAAG